MSNNLLRATLCCALPWVIHGSSHFIATPALVPMIVLIQVEEFF